MEATTLLFSVIFATSLMNNIKLRSLFHHWLFEFWISLWCRGPNEDVSYSHSRSSSRHNSVQYEPYSRHNSILSDSNSAHTSAQYDSPTRLGSGVCTDASQNSVHEETPIVRGLQRSTAFHNAITLQEQVATKILFFQSFQFWIFYNFSWNLMRNVIDCDEKKRRKRNEDERLSWDLG